MIADIARACRGGLSHMRAELKMSQLLRACSTFARVQDVEIPLSHAYYFTSEKGLFRLDRTGVYQILDIACYGIAIGGPWVFLSLQSHHRAMVVRGNRDALLGKNRDFAFREIYRSHITSSNNRIHGIYLGDRALWVANTGRNTLLEINPDTARVVNEIPIIQDRFDHPIVHNNNHINSVSEYGGIVLFVAYRAGTQSMIGIYDGATVTGYSYPRTGVHDIFLTETGFILCDTFGENTEQSGGVPITELGAYDPDFFAHPPGFIVRGLAGSSDELLIGHSHKGERSKRFEGHGAILVARGGKVIDRIDVRPAQVYQIISETGEFMSPLPASFEVNELHRVVQAALGEPICKANISVATGAEHDGADPNTAAELMSV